MLWKSRFKGIIYTKRLHYKPISESKNGISMHLTRSLSILYSSFSLNTITFSYFWLLVHLCLVKSEIDCFRFSIQTKLPHRVSNWLFSFQLKPIWSSHIFRDAVFNSGCVRILSDYHSRKQYFTAVTFVLEHNTIEKRINSTSDSFIFFNFIFYFYHLRSRLSSIQIILHV